MHNQRTKKRNILAKRLPEIKDLPYHQKLSIFGRGSLLGEEDVFSRTHFSCTLKCYSQKGTLYELSKEYFQLLKSSEQSWQAIMDKIIQKESRQQATHIKGVPRNFEKEMEKEEEEKERALSKNARLVNIHVRSNSPMRIRNPHYRTNESSNERSEEPRTLNSSSLSPPRNVSVMT